MQEEQLLNYYQMILQNLSHDINWAVRQQLAKYLGMMLVRLEGEKVIKEQ
jgi:hypothetical protein